MITPKESVWLILNFHSRTVYVWKNVLRNNCIQWNIYSSWTELVYNLEPHHCKITQCLCTRPKAGSVCSRTQYRSAVLKWSSRRERAKQKFLTPHGDRRNSSSQHQREGGLSCSVWWAERLETAWSSGVFLPPINKPPKTNSSTPQRGRWDSETRGKGRQVSGKNDICDRGH